MYVMSHEALVAPLTRRSFADVSTAYVDYLHSYSSPPQSPTPSISDVSPPRTRTNSTARVDSPAIPKTISSPPSTSPLQPNEATPLLLTQPAPEDEATALIVQAEPIDDIFGGSHHRFESREAHRTHSSTNRSQRVSAIALFDDEGRLYGQGDVIGEVPVQSDGPQLQVTGSVKAHKPSAHAHGARSHSHGHGHAHGHFHHGMDTWHQDEEHGIHEDEEITEEVRIGRQRQVVGILVSTSRLSPSISGEVTFVLLCRCSSWELCCIHWLSD